LLIDAHLLSRKKDFCRKNLWTAMGNFILLKPTKTSTAGTADQPLWFADRVKKLGWTHLYLYLLKHVERSQAPE
jgi:hypothetical protein